MKHVAAVALALIKFAKERGLGDACLLIACLGMLFHLIHSMGYHPLQGVLGTTSAHAKAHASPSPSPTP